MAENTFFSRRRWTRRAALAADSSSALKALDTDNDGTIDLKEAEAGAAKVFKSMDTDNEATVDAKELGNRLDALMPQPKAQLQSLRVENCNECTGREG